MKAAGARCPLGRCSFHPAPPPHAPAPPSPRPHATFLFPAPGVLWGCLRAARQGQRVSSQRKRVSPRGPGLRDDVGSCLEEPARERGRARFVSKTVQRSICCAYLTSATSRRKTIWGSRTDSQRALHWGCLCRTGHPCIPNLWTTMKMSVPVPTVPAVSDAAAETQKSKEPRERPSALSLTFAPGPANLSIMTLSPRGL